LAALDFAAPAGEQGCSPSEEFVTASAPGLVVRTGIGVVIVDLDGDGKEQTGWDILYMHIAATDKVEVGTWVNTDDPIGHPSCEGGNATGSHVHLARKFNGEWILADGPVPFVLSGWTAHMGSALYAGSLTKDDQIAVAQPYGSYESLVKRAINP
jgi:murein DD-endopeptidase MepM/ murein hydrolase activator NlpD